MTPDQQSLETELRGLQATQLDESFLQRLTEAADGTLLELTTSERLIENQLRAHRPAALDVDFLAGLEKIVADVPFPADDKILLFPKAAPAHSKPRKARPMWSAAAAVALIGAATALMVPSRERAPQAVTQQPPAAAITAPAAIASNPSSSNLVPASFNRGISEVHDEGIVWKGNNQPRSLVRIVYKELVTLKDENGRTFQVEQPKVKYVLVPAKAD